MANVFEKVGKSIKSVIGSFLAEDDYESEPDIKAVLIDESRKGGLSTEDALLLAKAVKNSNDEGVKLVKNQESSGNRLKKSPKKYTSHKDKEGSKIPPRDRGRER